MSHIVFWINRALAWALSLSGHVVIDAERLDTARALLLRTSETVQKSGHLSTVRGRKTTTIRNIEQALEASEGILQHGVRPAGEKLRWNLMAPKWIKRWARQGRAIDRKSA